jgi:hypothetical protein
MYCSFRRRRFRGRRRLGVWQKDLRTFIDVVYAKKADRLGIITAWKTKRSPIRPTRRRR